MTNDAHLTDEQLLLQEKINAFQIDEPGIKLPFSKRLARENGWTGEHTGQVIQEYKKFLFLCCVSSGVTPSNDVDQAWHLHLAYTRSYWTDLCRDTLGKEIHHTPTRGGEQEAEKYKRAYTDTLALYRKTFGLGPPAFIWPASEDRFCQSRYRHVDRAKYWLVKKPFTLSNAQEPAVFFLGCALVFMIPALWFPFFWVLTAFFGGEALLCLAQVDNSRSDWGCG